MPAPPSPLAGDDPFLDLGAPGDEHPRSLGDLLGADPGLVDQLVRSPRTRKVSDRELDHPGTRVGVGEGVDDRRPSPPSAQWSSIVTNRPPVARGRVQRREVERLDRVRSITRAEPLLAQRVRRLERLVERVAAAIR